MVNRVANMKQITNRIVVGATLVLLSFAYLLSSLPTSAASVNVALSSSASSVQQNNNFVVTATVNTSGEVSDALVRVNYDSSKVSYVSASYSGNPLDQDFGSQASANYYTADRYKLGAPFPTGSITIVRLTFKASASSGSTAISVDTGASSIGNAANGQPHTPLTASGVTVNFTAPPTPASTTSTPTTTSTPSTSTPVSGSPASTPTNSSTPQNPQDDTGTSQPTTQEQESNSNIDDDQPVPVSSFIDQTGYPVEIKVTDKNGDPVVGLEVKLDDQTANTNEEGIAEFNTVVAGEYTVEANGVKGTVNIVTSDPLFAQEFSFIQEETSSPLTYIIIVAAIVLAAAVIFLAMRFIKNRNNSSSGGQAIVSQNNEQNNGIPENDPRLQAEPPKAETVIEPNRGD
jgi:hypothetical protein